LIYQNPRPTFEEMAIHYPPGYDSHESEPSSEESSWLRQLAFEYGIAKRTRVVTRYKRGGRLLDVGCATGSFLRGMQSKESWEPYGVEINAAAARVARERYGLNVHIGTLEQAIFSDGFFDVVTMWDVLEHLHDPSSSLREVYRILKPEGILIIRAPNADSWNASLFGRYWAGWDAPRHLHVFTSSTLRALLAANHFQPRAWSCQSAADIMFLLSLRFWMTAKKKQGTILELMIKLLSQPFTRLLTAPIYYLSGLGLRGPLMVVVAAKQVHMNSVHPQQ
jgi:2-polyprenyl-3-methyl-5-hydroxy-6-metoxy-1,4-benzoquinol methylase